MKGLLGIYEFRIMNFDEQAECLWKKGIYLLNRKKVSYKVNLYWLDSFFVELYYNPDSNQITEFRTFKCSSCLSDYLDNIHIPL